MVAANSYCTHIAEELYAAFFFVGLSVMDDVAETKEAVDAFLAGAFYCMSQCIEFSLNVREYTVLHDL